MDLEVSVRTTSSSLLEAATTLEFFSLHGDVQAGGKNVVLLRVSYEFEALR